MADHITEEEQIEALKRWWDENGKQTILAIVLTLVAILAGKPGPSTLRTGMLLPHWPIRRCSISWLRLNPARYSG